MTKKRTKKQDVPVIGQRFITSDELLKIKVAIEQVNNIQMQVGGIEAQKSDLISSMKEKVMDYMIQNLHRILNQKKST